MMHNTIILAGGNCSWQLGPKLLYNIIVIVLVDLNLEIWYGIIIYNYNNIQVRNDVI